MVDIHRRTDVTWDQKARRVGEDEDCEAVCGVGGDEVDEFVVFAEGS